MRLAISNLSFSPDRSRGGAGREAREGREACSRRWRPRVSSRLAGGADPRGGVGRSPGVAAGQDDGGAAPGERVSGRLADAGARASYGVGDGPDRMRLPDEPAAQLGIRFAVAQLIAVAPQVGSRTSVAAKGLTGEGYKGHVFWDTDVFLMQFYAYTMPEVAREIIGYRVGTLPAARSA